MYDHTHKRTCMTNIYRDTYYLQTDKFLQGADMFNDSNGFLMNDRGAVGSLSAYYSFTP